MDSDIAVVQSFFTKPYEHQFNSYAFCPPDIAAFSLPTREKPPGGPCVTGKEADSP